MALKSTAAKGMTVRRLRNSYWKLQNRYPRLRGLYDLSHASRRSGQKAHPPPKSRFDTAKDIITLLVTASVFGFGIYQFVYVNIMQVSRQPAALVLACDVQQVGHRGPLTALKVTTSIHNTSKVRVYAMAAWFNVQGIKITPHPPVEDAAYHQYVASVTGDQKFKEGSVVNVGRHWEEHGGQIIDCGKVMADENWFEPDESDTTTMMVYVPTDRYDLIKVGFSVAMSKNSDKVRTRLLADGDGALRPVVERRTEEGASGWHPIGSGDDYKSGKWEQENGVEEADTFSEYAFCDPPPAQSVTPAAAKQPADDRPKN